MTKKKVCLVGSFAVGKTSLVRKFVRGIFSDDYLTTVGVKVDQKSVDVEGEEVRLMIWDIAGSDELHPVEKGHLRGAAGIIYVADGTRRETLNEILDDLDAKEPETQEPVRVLLLLNKVDLRSEWEVEESTLDELRARVPVFLTSAKTGERVEDAFAEMARRLVSD